MSRLERHMNTLNELLKDNKNEEEIKLNNDCK